MNVNTLNFMISYYKRKGADEVKKIIFQKENATCSSK